jgi:DNA polymerase IV (DinB-like DNA polymerase)
MPHGETLPGAPTSEDRIVLHVDMDCFYASCERLREPKLRGEPVVVGMGYEEGEQTGAVATASYEAREYGVESAMGISSALDRLPRREDTHDDPDTAWYRPVDMDFYESVSEDVRAILEELADTLRIVSIDEAYLDVTGRTAWDVAEGFGRHVKQRIDRAVGVPASVGVAPNMSTAKIASDHDKPDGLVVVSPDEVADFLAPLPVGDIHGIGPVTADELTDMGIETAADLADADPTILRDKFGERGEEFHRRALGDDPRPVEPRGKPKSLSRESAFDGAVEDFALVTERATGLANAVAQRARRRGALYRTIGVKVVTPPYDVNTWATSLSGPIDEPDLVESVALDLLEEFDGERIRKVGVRVANLSFSDRDQADLESWETVDDGESESASDSESATGRTRRYTYDQARLFEYERDGADGD